LIELLVVIAIIGILVGLLLPAIAKARQYANIVKAKSEVKQIETALRAYYQEYQQWPTTTTPNLPGGVDTAVPIQGQLFDVLQANNTANNPKNITFMTFKKVRVPPPVGQAAQNNSGPVNPWGTTASGDVTGYYYVKFDADFDNVINLSSSDLGLPGGWPTISVRSPVVVWTINPSGVGITNKVIGSWW